MKREVLRLHRLFNWYWVIKILFFLALIYSEQNPASLEDQLWGLRVLKFGLFGWSNKRLVQTEGDLDFSKRIDSNLESELLKLVFVPYLYYKLLLEVTLVKVVAIHEYRMQGDTMRGLSVRFTWFELVKSLVTFDTPILYIAKRGVLAVNPKCEYDPETNRIDAVS